MSSEPLKGPNLSDSSPNIPMQEMPTFSKPGHVLVRQGKPNEPHLPKGKGIVDLPLNERRKYLDPNQDPTHHSVTQTDTTCRCEDAQKAKEKKNADQEKKITSQAETIQTMAQHITTLTDMLNKLIAKYPV